MRTQEITIYSFEELTPKAQQRAIKKNEQINVDFNDWTDPIIEEATEAAKAEGFTFKKMYYTGFWSQGDGAMFEYTGLENEILKNKFIDSLKLSPIRKNWLKNNIHASAGGKQSGKYCHEYSCSHRVYWEIDNANLHYSTNFYKWMASYEKKFEDFIIEKYVNICQDIYKKLSTYYDELTSAKYISDTLINNGFEFTEEGNTY